jgi:small subunit ribosomal protein S5
MQRKRYSYINPDQLNLHVERVIHTNRVSKTHKGGRTLSFQVMVVVGDTNGHVGVGLGKARQVPDAIRKAIEAARRNLVYVPRVGTTIPHEVEVEYGATRLVLKPASPGTGIVAGSSVRALLEAAGVSDVLAKLVGSRNAINAAWATMEAFRALRTPEEVAQTRGMYANSRRQRRHEHAQNHAQTQPHRLFGEPKTHRARARTAQTQPNRLPSR